MSVGSAKEVNRRITNTWHVAKRVERK